MRFVYVNSTLRARERLQPGGALSPLHYWGYFPQPDDAVLGHRLNRVEITLRARLGGIDPSVFLHTCRHLARGATGIYLVTQPDLWQALPLLRKMFPTRRFVTWAWMDWEVDRHLHELRVCDHVLCLTEGAKRRLDELDLGAQSSLAIWGAPPAYYALENTVETDTDVLIAGLVSRDVALMRSALGRRRFTALISEQSFQKLGFDRAGDEGVAVARFDTRAAIITAFRRARVSWIPLLREDPYPSGYTNLVESLLCGTAVVIGDTSGIPQRVLSLPGVFRYRVGSVEDFVGRTEEAIAWMNRAGSRDAVISAATPVLDGAGLARTIRVKLGIEQGTS